MLASTFPGGPDLDVIHSLLIGSAGNIYVAGTTESSDFPTSTGAYDRIYNDGSSAWSYQDPFVAKFDANLKNLKVFYPVNDCAMKE